MFRALAIAACCGCTAFVSAAEPPRVVQNLGDECIAAVELPDLGAFWSAYSRTRLIQLFSEQGRGEQMLALARKHAGAEAEAEFGAFTASLAKHGLAPADLGLVATGGPLGVAVLQLGLDAQQEPQFGALLWCEPAGDLTDRLLQALDRAVEEHPNEVRRTDIDADGLQVRMLTPVQEPRPAVPAPAAGDEAGDLEEDMEESEREQPVVQIVRHERRLVVLLTAPALAETARGSLRQAALGTGQGAFLTRIAASGARADLDANQLPMFHAYGDLRPFWRQLENAAQTAKTKPHNERDADPDQGDNGTDMALKVLRSTGLLGIETLALSSGFAPTGQIQTQGTIIVPQAQRTGLMKLVDVPPQRCVVPAWAPADAIGYSQLAVDLPALYSAGIEIAQAVGGEDFAPRLKGFEAMAQGFLGMPVSQLLSAFGDRIQVAALPSKPGATPEAPVRDAQVWAMPLRNEETLRGLVQNLGQFVASQGGTYADEQGFAVLRFTPPTDAGNEFAVFVGRGHIGFAQGSGLASQVMGDLVAPPAEGLAASAVMQRGQAMLSGQPALVIQCQDTGAVLANAGTILTGLAAMMPDDDMELQFEDEKGAGEPRFDDKRKVQKGMAGFLRELVSLLPSSDELRSAGGIDASELTVDAQGLHLRGRTEVPLAK
jgi:hypothetical protein